ncbi:hypothetical protein NITLEN_80139 [Nitrospira lenta]|uniref:Uncharacterized protein n=1 Tax=Nitrospira lenta TaxID=1436998 RepID=A0A330LAH0_9BACT|nr:hypothetical protein NITLEN_80139 [Nitrospira lenta]
MVFRCQSRPLAVFARCVFMWSLGQFKLRNLVLIHAEYVAFLPKDGGYRIRLPDSFGIDTGMAYV